MSYGKLCEAKIKIMDSTNSESGRIVSCCLYEGHEGDHAKSFYHVVKRKGQGYVNYNVGSITWNDEKLKL